MHRRWSPHRANWAAWVLPHASGDDEDLRRAAHAPRYRTGVIPRRLLLHLGLAKTATSSFQRNVLAALHAEGRIHAPAFGPRGEELADLVEGLRKRRLPAAELDERAITLEGMLDGSRLNVVSDERIPASPDAEAALWNLRAVCRNATVRTLVCLRSPVDLTHLVFVQEQRSAPADWLRTFPTFDAFFAGRVESGRRQDLFQDRYLELVGRHFPDIEVVLYEDLRHDRPAWIATVARCLESDPAVIERLMSAAPRNVSVRTDTGVVARPAIMRRVVPWLAARWPLYARCRPILQRFEGPALRILARAGLAAVHPYPAPALRERVLHLVGLREDTLTRRYGVSAAKLARYGYLHPASAGLRSGSGAGV